MKIFQTVLIVVLVGCSTTTKADVFGPRDQNIIKYVGEQLGRCFENRNNAEEVVYTGDNILEVLNAQAGVELFQPSQNGLKINIEVFGDVLSNCIQSSSADSTKPIHVNKRDLTFLLNLLLQNREVGVKDLDIMVNSRYLNPRFRRDLAFPLNLFQDVISSMILQPLITQISLTFDVIDNRILSYYVDPTSVKDPIQSLIISTVNGAVQTASGIIKNLKAQIAVLFSPQSSTDNVSTTRPIQTEKTSLQTRDVFTDLIENVFFKPLRDLVKTGLQTIRNLINSYYVQTLSDNPVQKIMEEITNSIVSVILGIVDTIQQQVDLILGSLEIVTPAPA